MIYYSENSDRSLRMVKVMENKCLDIITEYLPEHCSCGLQNVRSAVEDKITEIVLRSDRPLCIYLSKRLFYVTENGCLTDSYLTKGLVTISGKDIESTVLKLCDYSIYAFQNEINSGFITVKGGIRVGICGKAVINNGKLSNVRDIGTLSFRIPRDVRGCSLSLLQKIDPLGGVLLCSAPGRGKTTMIRDMARELSYRYRVSLLDEREELSAYSRGKYGFSLGLCDVYAGYPKGIAANCAIRSMAPDIIVCDEMGERDDVDLLMYSLRSGVSFIATVHAQSMQDLRRRRITYDLINTGAFRYIVFLSLDTIGKVEKIYEMCDSRD